MKKAGLFSEKICITASSQDNARKTPVSFVTRRGVVVAAITVVALLVALSVYTAVSSLLTIRGLASKTESLKQTLQVQSGELAKYEQQIREMQQAQPDFEAAEEGVEEPVEVSGGDDAGASSGTGAEEETVIVQDELAAKTGA